MNDSRFLIIGANGQLGKALHEQYPNAICVDSQELDITDPGSVNAFDWTNISHILNAAAYTNVDGAETAEGRAAAWRVNATAVGYLTDIASQHGITLLHISSDYVFDGTKKLYTEEEVLSPLSVYGASKAAGDVAAERTTKHYILRTSWVIGDGNNFVRTMISLANKNISPTVVHDQVGRLTFTNELVRAIDHLLTKDCEYGIYNVSNDGESASWADITREIFACLNRSDLKVTNTTTEEYYEGKEGIAPRPLQSMLDLSKVNSTGFQSTSWQLELKRYIQENK